MKKMTSWCIFAFLFFSLPVASQSDDLLDGVLEFDEFGVSSIEMLPAVDVGRNTLRLVYEDGEPFSARDGWCQVAGLNHIDEAWTYALSTTDDGEWLAYISSLLDLDSSQEGDVPILVVQCFLRGS